MNREPTTKGFIVKVFGIIAASLLLVEARAMAEVKPASMFGDHMVLQRDMPIPVWGDAEAGESVTVRFAGNEVTTNANKSGKWHVELPALDASAVGREMVIEGTGGRQDSGSRMDAAGLGRETAAFQERARRVVVT